MATKSSVNNRRSSARNNCGTGAGGFQSGNDCAKGGGGGSGKSAVPKDYKKPGTVAEVRQDAERFARTTIKENFTTEFVQSEGGKGEIVFLFPNSAIADQHADAVDRIGESMKIRVNTGVNRNLSSKEEESQQRQEKREMQQAIRDRMNGRTRNSCNDETITCIIGNAKGKIQKKTLAGQEYLVAPITLIVPGVLSGSQGSGFYSKTENGKNVRAWNSMPLLMGHPKPGEGSGRNADIFNDRYLGFVLDVKNGDKLEGKAYFSVTALNTVKGGTQLKRMLTNNEPIEVSTGLDLERLKQKGTHNGDSYDWIAKNYQPDHVAVLLDEKGACSTKDGCGINNAEDDVTENNCGIGSDGFESGNDCAKGGGGGGSGAAIDKALRSSERADKKDTASAHRAAARALHAVVAQMMKPGQKADPVMTHSLRKDAMRHETRARVLAEGLDTKNAEYCEECGEEECNCESAEDDTTNSISNEEETMSKKMTKAQRAEVINSIVENGCDCYTEEDVDALNTYTDERLQKISEHLEEHVTNKELVTNGKGVDFGKVAARRLKNSMSDDEIEAEYKNRQAKKASAANEFPPKEEDGEKEEGDEDEEKKVPAFMKKGKAKNAEATPEQTMNEWLKAAPPEARSTLNRMFQRDKKEREQLLETIVNHYVPDGDEDEAKSVYDVHNAMSIEHLEMLATRIKKDEVQNHEEEREARPSFTGRVPALNGRKQEAKKAGTPLGVPQIDQMFSVINGRKTSSFQN